MSTNKNNNRVLEPVLRPVTKRSLEAEERLRKSVKQLQETVKNKDREINLLKSDHSMALSNAELEIESIKDIADFRTEALRTEKAYNRKLKRLVILLDVLSVVNIVFVSYIMIMRLI